MGVENKFDVSIAEPVDPNDIENMFSDEDVAPQF